MKILVVEDDVRLASLVRRGLEADGHVIENAYTAGDGWNRAWAGYFDVLILDIKLPDSDGMTLCNNLRKEGFTTPILMLTARDSVDDKVAGLRAGADDYLTKPFSFDELKARLEALTRRPSQYVDTNVLLIRNVELNPATSEVKVDDAVVTLTRKEFAVLELLMRNVNQVLTREQILDRVWSTESEPVANVVDAVIARLRAKIDRNRRMKPFIKTVRGLGYKIQL
ncbi:response regulator transcription factor [Alicyclobacillus tolerans]|uniref:response regulator transcription factor n=1 Tax=Alicyclobacillus tolerans TaxID=90970 RepID=UPI001F2834E1|nr:response regulator transcription factor [Alicyclobacillus tolerans]MCF8564919.1 response regulator transcription factor [Alicyclobacillus tolerans]